MKRNIPKNTAYFTYANANPKGKITGDCVIRALATAMNKTWDEVLTDLYQYALKHKQMLDCSQLYSKYLKDQGWIKLKQPRKYDNTKYTGIEFCEELQSSTCFKHEGYYLDSCDKFIAHIGGHHVVAIVNGSILDTWNSTGGCIGNIWIKE